MRVFANTNPLSCKSIRNPWRRLSQAVASSNRSSRSIAMLRSKRFRLTQVPNVPKFQLFQSWTNRQERIRWNQLALFGLWLRGFPEWLHGGRDERGETTRKCLTSTSRRGWFVLFVIEKLEPLPHGCAFHGFAFRVSSAIPVPQPKPEPPKG